jgi:hypothetical protein
MVNALTPGDGTKPARIDIPQVKHRIMPRTKTVTSIEVGDFMRLAGWYLSEGCCTDPATANPGSRGRVFISQHAANQEFRDEIEALLTRIGLRPSASVGGFAFSSFSIAAFLIEQFGHGSHCKKIPRWVKDLDPKILTILRDTMMKGDGTKTGFAYTSFSQQLRDDFQEICLLTGWRASVHGNIVGIGKKQIYPEIRVKPGEVEYSGMIGCAAVPNHTLIVRRNGVPAVSGNSYNDFGHNEDDKRFFEQMDFLTPETLRVLKPGRMYCLHCKDRLLYGSVTGLGMYSVNRFSDKCADHLERHGFICCGRITIVTDVVRENNQTYRLGWTEKCKDGTKMGVGSPEYILLFRKLPTDTSRAYADTPVVKSKQQYTRSRWQFDASPFWRSNGDRFLNPEEIRRLPQEVLRQAWHAYNQTHVYDFNQHVGIAEALESQGLLPATFMLLDPTSHGPWVWPDISRMRTLNTEQSRRRLEMHICPLQLQLVERLIETYSGPGELVFDPFAGIMTVPYVAIKMGRKGYGIELSTDYWKDGVAYCQAAEAKYTMPSLFDVLDAESGPPSEPSLPLEPPCST